MNNKRHAHQAVLRQPLYGNDAAKWYVVYGDQTETLAEAGNPYEWDAEKRERVVGEAVATVVARHDNITATSRHLDAILNGARRPWWRLW